jgi:hypothetical protein
VAVDEQTQHLLLTGDELLHELTNSALLLRPNVCTFAVALATPGGAMRNVPASARNHLTATAWAVVLANTQFCHAHLLPTHRTPDLQRYRAGRATDPEQVAMGEQAASGT